MRDFTNTFVKVPGTSGENSHADLQEPVRHAKSITSLGSDPLSLPTVRINRLVTAVAEEARYKSRQMDRIRNHRNIRLYVNFGQ